MKYSPFLASISAVFFITATHANNYIQNDTDSNLTVIYEYCSTSSPNIPCTGSYISGRIFPNQAYSIPPGPSGYNIVELTSAHTDDLWVYITQSAPFVGCAMPISSTLPLFVTFSKSMVQDLLQCQNTIGIKNITKN